MQKQLADIQQLFNPIVSNCDIANQLSALTSKNIDKDNFFYGKAIAIKDNYNYCGTLTTASSRILSNYIAPYNATVVENLIDAGAIIVAKTSLDELGMGGSNKSAYTGPVLNPFDRTRISGGSSGGSAVLVASEIVEFALGTDTGDSVRKPASYCGIVGVKPTYGLISRYGVIPYASSLDHVGYFTKDVLSAAKALKILVGRDDKDMTSLNTVPIDYASLVDSDIKNKKIAVFGNVVDNLSNTQVKEAFDDLVIKLKDAGAIVEVVYLDDQLLRTLLPVYYIIANCEASANHSNLDGLRFGRQEDGQDTETVMINSRTKGLSSMIRKRLIMGSYALFAENQERLFRKAQKVRRVIAQKFGAVFAEYTAIIAPASGDIAPLLDQQPDNELDNRYLISENYMVYANFMGLPSMTIPLTKVQGLPVGINITTGKCAEVQMFSIGKKIEEIVQFKRWEETL